MFRDLVIKNRSYRTFDQSCIVTHDVLLELADTARHTPSAANLQPLRYIPLTKSNADKILPYTRWARALDIKLPPDGCAPTAFILVCIDKNVTPNGASAMIDVGIAAQTILLAAAEKGLGGCMILSFDGAKIQSELSLDEKVEILLCIALGKPGETVLLEDSVDGSVKYYRDENNVHHVPKRKLCDVIIDIE